MGGRQLGPGRASGPGKALAPQSRGPGPGREDGCRGQGLAGVRSRHIRPGKRSGHRTPRRFHEQVPPPGPGCLDRQGRHVRGEPVPAGPPSAGSGGPLRVEVEPRIRLPCGRPRAGPANAVYSSWHRGGPKAPSAQPPGRSQAPPGSPQRLPRRAGPPGCCAVRLQCRKRSYQEGGRGAPERQRGSLRTFGNTPIRRTRQVPALAAAAEAPSGSPATSRPAGP
jgi:hypothetical protein